MPVPSTPTSLIPKRQLHAILAQYHPCRVLEGADKSLARPGRKQATATKLGIFSTYSPWSSKHFLARCSNFYRSLKKKKFRRLSVHPGLRGSIDIRVGRKMATFQLFFYSVQWTGCSPTGSDPESRVGDRDIASPGTPVSSGLQVVGKRFPFHLKCSS